MPTNEEQKVAPPIINHDFLEELGENAFSRRSFDKWERVMHAHGEGVIEGYLLRYGGEFPRTPDVIIFPESHEQVVVIIN